MYHFTLYACMHEYIHTYTHIIPLANRTVIHDRVLTQDRIQTQDRTLLHYSNSAAFRSVRDDAVTPKMCRYPPNKGLHPMTPDRVQSIHNPRLEMVSRANF